jgi:uncharacterized protein (TIGR00251 family)
MSWACEKNTGTEISVRVVPRASRTAVAETLGNALKIRLQAPPVDGKANRALIKFLAKQLGTSQRNITLLSGDTSRNKRLLIQGVSAKAVTDRLCPIKKAEI